MGGLVAWIVDDIARDIAEMATYPAESLIELTVTQAGAADTYRVATAAAARSFSPGYFVPTTTVSGPGSGWLVALAKPAAFSIALYSANV